jgi:hypothetical protein
MKENQRKNGEKEGEEGSSGLDREQRMKDQW